MRKLRRILAYPFFGLAVVFGNIGLFIDGWEPVEDGYCPACGDRRED